MLDHRETTNSITVHARFTGPVLEYNCYVVSSQLYLSTGLELFSRRDY
jgi:hypothetical protein